MIFVPVSSLLELVSFPYKEWTVVVQYSQDDIACGSVIPMWIERREGWEEIVYEKQQGLATVSEKEPNNWGEEVCRSEGQRCVAWDETGGEQES